MDLNLCRDFGYNFHMERFLNINFHYLCNQYPSVVDEAEEIIMNLRYSDPDDYDEELDLFEYLCKERFRICVLFDLKDPDATAGETPDYSDNLEDLI